MNNVEILHKMERAYVNEVKAAPGGVGCGPFLIHLNPDSDLVWLNNAVLEDEQAPLDAHSVRDMMDVFLRAKRKPRMELFKELRPQLVGLLKAEGFSEESETPVLVCGKEDFLPFRTTDVQVDWVTAEVDPKPFLRAVDAAFGSTDEITPERVERLRQSLRRGSSWCAQARIEGQVVGGATLVPSEGTAELAGVGTHPDHRRRGVALAVSSFLMSEFFNSGNVVWLSAADDAARAVYERLGFRFVGTQVNISYSSSAEA